MLGVFPVIPAALILPLTENLYGRHGTRILSLGHVKVIDENDGPQAQLGSIVTPPSSLLIQLEIDNILRHICLRLRRIANLNVDEFVLRQLIQEHIARIG